MYIYFFRSETEMSYIATIIKLLLSVMLIINPITALVKNGGEDAFFDDWSTKTEFTANYAQTVEKNPDEDFKILYLTDLQLEKWQAYSDVGYKTWETVDYLVKETNPDLIVLPGDNAWSTVTYLKTIECIDSYGIPWAPIMGNHDGSCCINEFWCTYEMYEAENCLFEFGPKNMGYGNYIVNITENGEIIHSLFLTDTHSDLSGGGNINGEKDSGYDHLWSNQLDWYEWAVNGISALAGRTVESTVVMHIPLVEYKEAYAQAYDEQTGAYKAEYADTSFGENREDVCCASENNGFFDLCKKLGSTKNIICGHDHTNSSSIVYEGIRLTYALKCGPGAYWNEDMSGGTLQTIASDGSSDINHIYYTK